MIPGGDDYNDDNDDDKDNDYDLLRNISNKQEFK